MSGTIYLVATPIGNLQDLTPRAAATLGSVDFVAAEDTRVTLRLLNHLGLKKPLVSYHEHNAAARGGQIVSRVLAGESCAVCSDAGMPCISDPGEALVREALAAGITVVPVPAASAAVTALAASGQASGRWCFEGFLPMNKNQRRARLQALQDEERTMIFYEAPHKLPATLEDLCATFGAARSLTVCRELTKLHEEICKTTLGEARARYADTPPRGEFCLVVAGAAPAEAPAPADALAAAVTLARGLLAAGQSPSAAARAAAHQTGAARAAVYRALLDEQAGTDTDGGTGEREDTDEGAGTHEQAGTDTEEGVGTHEQAGTGAKNTVD